MIIITGATGHLGQHVIEQLLQKVPASGIAVAVRNVEKAAGLAALGIEVRHADYDQKETLATAFRGATKVLLISGSEVGKRANQHQNVIDAVKAAQPALLVYTSILNADHSGVSLAKEHVATEQLIRASGIPFVFLRNGWYIENYTENLAPALQFGAIAGSAGDGRIAAATRADYAGAAVEALTGEGHAYHIYELAGDSPFTMAELAAEVARQSGKPVVYNDLPPTQYRDFLISVGLPAPFAEVLVDADLGIGRGELNSNSTDLRRLLKRPTTSLSEAVEKALAG